MVLCLKNCTEAQMWTTLCLQKNWCMMQFIVFWLFHSFDVYGFIARKIAKRISSARIREGSSLIFCDSSKTRLDFPSTLLRTIIIISFRFARSTSRDCESLSRWHRHVFWHQRKTIEAKMRKPPFHIYYLISPFLVLRLPIFLTVTKWIDDLLGEFDERWACRQSIPRCYRFLL